MARELNWTDAQEIGIQLQEMFPETDPYSVRVHRSAQVGGAVAGVCGRSKSNEKILEAIQTAWHEEYEDGKGIVCQYPAASIRL